MSTVLWALAAFTAGAVVFGYIGYWAGRRSNVERAVDRRLNREMARIPINHQAAAEADLLTLRWLHAEAAHWRDVYEQEVDRLRREVEFEARPEEFYWTPPSPTDPCACISNDQAAQLTSAGFTRPLCAVHPEDGDANVD